MGVEWRDVKLGDVVNLSTGYPFKSKYYTDDSDAPRLIGGDNIAQGNLRWDSVRRWPRDMIDGLDDYWLEPGDVVLAMDRPWIDAGLKLAVVGSQDVPSLLVQRTSRLRGTDKLNSAFIRYVIGSQSFSKYILSVQTGTAIPHISPGQIKAYCFSLPPLIEQQAIAHILGTLDDKIELNRRMSETLEAMARALFKSWFVDFDPVRAKMEGREPFLPPDIWRLFPDKLDNEGKPEGWDLQPLSKLLTIIGGGTPKTSVEEFWNGDIPWFSVVDTPPEGNVFVIDTEKTITAHGLAASSARLIPKGTTIISARGTVGNLAVAGREMAFNQSCYGLRGGFAGDYFVYLTAQKMVDQLKSMAHGSVFSTITRQTFDAIQCAVPPRDLLATFERLVTSWFDSILTNVEESKTLAKLRDTLLPILISGELRVKDAEKFVEAVV